MKTFGVDTSGYVLTSVLTVPLVGICVYTALTKHDIQRQDIFFAIVLLAIVLFVWVGVIRTRISYNGSEIHYRGATSGFSVQMSEVEQLLVIKAGKGPASFLQLKRGKRLKMHLKPFSKEAAQGVCQLLIQNGAEVYIQNDFRCQLMAKALGLIQ